MKHLIFLAIATLALTACDTSVNGTLKVAQSFNVKNNDGDTITVAPGSYGSTLTMKDRKTLDVIFKMNGDTQTVRIKFPSDVSLPSDGNGQFFIKGSDDNMPFDTKGTLQTTVVNGPQQQGLSTCYMPQPAPVCFPIPSGGSSCIPSPAPTQGIMTVVYHLQTTTVKADALFTAPTSSATMASFSGTRSDTAEIYDYQGLCHY